MGYKPKYLLIYTDDKYKSKLLEDGHFSEPLEKHIDDDKIARYEYEHYTLLMVKRDLSSSCQLLMFCGCRVAKIFLSEDIQEKIQNDTSWYDAYLDCIQPMLEGHYIIGSHTPEIINYESEVQ